MKKGLVFFSLLLSLVLLNPPTSFAVGATMVLDPSSGNISPNCSINVAVKINTTGIETDGADAILLYEADVLTTTNQDITNGTIYQDYSNDASTTPGVVEIHGIADVAKPFADTGTLATVKFKVQPDAPTSGFTDLTIKFNSVRKDDTSESNIVRRGTISDILDQVTNAKFTLTSGSCTPGTVTPSASPGSGSSPIGGNGSRIGVNTPPNNGSLGSLTGGSKGGPNVGTNSGVIKKNLDDLVGGKTGLLDNTLVIAGIGGFFLVAGILGLLLL